MDQHLHRIFFWPIGQISISRFQPCASFGFFQISHLPFIKITFLDTCQKTVSTHAPQFRSNLSVTPKLIPIMITNNQIDLCFPNRRCVKSSFYPPSKGYKYLRLSLRWHLSYSTSLLHLSPKNKPVLPPSAQPKHPPRVRGFKLKNLPLQQWRPFPRSQRYFQPLCPHSLFPIFFPISPFASLIFAFIFRILGVR